MIVLDDIIAIIFICLFFGILSLICMFFDRCENTYDEYTPLTY
jgi:hypothetical protein